MRRYTRLLAFAFALVLSVSVVLIAYAQQGTIPPQSPGCSHGSAHLIGQTYPTQDLEPETPIWCYSQAQAGPATREDNGNDWTDTWDNDGPAIQTLRSGDYDYNVFDTFDRNGSRIRAGSFVNSDHWMLDIADISPFSLSAGILVSPNRSFQFEDGTLVVEVDAAAGGDGMGGADLFYEMDLTPADKLSRFSVDTLYGYGSFGGLAAAMGCRMERNDDGGHFVCAMYDDSNRVTGGECPRDGRVCKDNGGHPGRVWETQGVGIPRTARSVQGGYPGWQIPGTGLRLGDVWRQCGTNEHDLHCRDRFRMEVTKDSIHLFVNGYPAMLIDGLYAVNPATGADNRIPDSWFDGTRAYFTSWKNGGEHDPVRWHWNEVRINPHAADGSIAPPSASPSFCFGEAARPPAVTTRNTCIHAHVPGQPEVGPTTEPPVDTNPTSTPLPVTTPTPGPKPTQGPTATPEPIEDCLISASRGQQVFWVTTAPANACQ